MSGRKRRIVVCLDVKGGRVVKGTRFADLRDVGDPAELASRYEAAGADEIVLLDVSASSEGRETFFDVIRRAAERLFIPLTIGGGLRSAEDATRALRAGADKVSFNTQAVLRPELLTEVADVVGAQCLVASVDARRVPGAPPGELRYRVFTHGGSRPTEIDAVEWAERAVALGAGELLVTSIDRDGTRAGYDLALTRAVASAVDVPVVASGGAGSADDIEAVLGTEGVEAALIAGVVHDGTLTVEAIKRHLAERGLPVRLTGAEEKTAGRPSQETSFGLEGVR